MTPYLFDDSASAERAAFILAEKTARLRVLFLSRSPTSVVSELASHLVPILEERRAVAHHQVISCALPESAILAFSPTHVVVDADWWSYALTVSVQSQFPDVRWTFYRFPQAMRWQEPKKDAGFPHIPMFEEAQKPDTVLQAAKAWFQRLLGLDHNSQVTAMWLQHFLT